MYKVKPYNEHDAPVKIPDCMYRLKPTDSHVGSHTEKDHKMVQLELEPEIIRPDVHGRPLGTRPEHPILLNKGEKPCVQHKQHVDDEVDITELIALEARQEDILTRLEGLKAKVAQLVKSDRSSGAVSQVGSGMVQDLVLSAHPSQPPVSLLVLQQLLAKQYKMMTSCHCHSSVSGVPDPLRNIFGQKADTINRAKYDLVFTLMWKDVKNGPTLMVDPKSQVLLEGEGTIARYLARLLNPSYESADNVRTTEIDQWVDTMGQFTRGNNKEKNAILKNLNSKLGKCDWLMGDEISLADVVMWSVVIGNDGIPGNVKAWCERCSNIHEFRTVLDRLGIGC